MVNDRKKSIQCSAYPADQFYLGATMEESVDLIPLYKHLNLITHHPAKSASNLFPLNVTENGLERNGPHFNVAPICIVIFFWKQDHIIYIRSVHLLFLKQFFSGK